MDNQGQDNSSPNQANQAVDDTQNLGSVTQVPTSTAVQKEQEPLNVQKSEEEPVLSKELKEIGVEANTEVPKLTEDHEKIGIVHVKESTPVATQPQGNVQIPMNGSKAKQVLKVHQKVSESIRWLATLVLKQINKGNE